MKKEAILNQAKELFLKHGVKTIGMDDIAQSLQISKKTIYQYFSSKEELIKHTLDYTYEMVFGEIHKIIGKCKSPIHEHFEIKKSVNNILGLEIKKSEFMFQLKKYYPNLTIDFEKKHYFDHKKITSENLKTGIKKGLYKDNIDIDFVCSQFFIGQRAFETDAIFVENFMDNFSQPRFDYHFLDYHLRTICTKKGIEILDKLLKKYEL